MSRLRKCGEISSENLCVDIGAQRVGAETQQQACHGFFKLTVYVLSNKTRTFFFNSINAKTHFKLFKKLVNSVK